MLEEFRGPGCSTVNWETSQMIWSFPRFLMSQQFQHCQAGVQRRSQGSSQWTEEAPQRAVWVDQPYRTFSKWRKPNSMQPDVESTFVSVTNHGKRHGTKKKKTVEKIRRAFGNIKRLRSAVPITLLTSIYLVENIWSFTCYWSSSANVNFPGSCGTPHSSLVLLDRELRRRFHSAGLHLPAHSLETFSRWQGGRRRAPLTCFSLSSQSPTDCCSKP